MTTRTRRLVLLAALVVALTIPTEMVLLRAITQDDRTAAAIWANGLRHHQLVETLRVTRPRLRALFISGYADAVLSKQGGLPRDAHVLQKPFTGIDLLVKVRQILTLPTA